MVAIVNTPNHNFDVNFRISRMHAERLEQVLIVNLVNKLSRNYVMCADCLIGFVECESRESRFLCLQLWPGMYKYVKCIWLNTKV